MYFLLKALVVIETIITKKHKQTFKRKEKKRSITSRSREAGKATVRDSAKAGESHEIENKATEAAANPTTPLPNDLTHSLLRLQTCPSDLVPSPLYKQQGFETLHLRLKWSFKHENGRICNGCEMGLGGFDEKGEQ